jgi:hypothetical protein
MIPRISREYFYLIHICIKMAAHPVFIPQPAIEEPKVAIYVLKLEHDKYYVGRTANSQTAVFKRFHEHSQSLGAGFTRLHKPLSIHDIIHDCDVYDETKTFYKTVAKFGIDNVRGGPFVTTELSAMEKMLIRREIDNASSKCFDCHQLHCYRTCRLKQQLKHPSIRLTELMTGKSSNPLRPKIPVISICPTPAMISVPQMFQIE